MIDVVLQDDSLQLITFVILKQVGVLFTTHKVGLGVEGLAELVAVTSEVIRHKICVDIAAHTEDAVAHPVAALLDLGDDKHTRVHDGALPPALGSTVNIHQSHGDKYEEQPHIVNDLCVFLSVKVLRYSPSLNVAYF